MDVVTNVQFNLYENQIVFGKVLILVKKRPKFFHIFRGFILLDFARSSKIEAAKCLEPRFNP